MPKRSAVIEGSAWRSKRAAVLVVLAVPLIAVVLALTGNDRVARIRLSNGAQLAAAVVAAASAATQGGHAGRRRLSLRLVTAAALSWAAGQAIWTVAQWHGGAPPFPSVADLGFIASLPLLAAAFVVSPIDIVRRGRTRAALDSVAITGSIIFVAVALGRERLIGRWPHDAATALALTYPVLDLALLAVLLTILARSRRGRRGGVSMMASGIVLLALADSGFAYLRGEYVTGSLIDVGWVVGWLLIGAAATRMDDEGTDDEHVDAVATAAAWVSAAAAITVAGAVIARRLNGDAVTADPFLFAVGVAVFVLTGVRLAVAQLDTIALATLLKRQLREYAHTIDRYEEALLHAGARMWEWDSRTRQIRWSPPWKGSEKAPEATPEAFVASLHPDDRVRVLEAIAAAINGHQPFDLTYRREMADGSTCWFRNTGRAIYHEGSRRTQVFGLATDVTVQREAAARGEKRLRESAALLEIGELASRLDDLGTFLETALEVLATALDAPFTKVLRSSGDGGPFTMQAGTGWRAGVAGSATVPHDKGSQAGYTAAAKEPILVVDLATESRFSAPALLTEHGIRSGISTVIRTEHGVWGVLGVHSPAPDAFGEEDALFLAAVANVVGHAIDHAAAIDRLRHNATHDDVTGLPNRALLLDRVRTMVADARRHRRYAAVVHVALEKFKLVNETYGYAAGNELLVDVARRLRSSVGPEATVARFAGDEFVIAAIVADQVDGANLASRALAALQPPFALGEPPEEVFLSSSAGLVVANGRGEADVMLRNAAAATAQAQGNGGGRYEIHDSRLRERAVRRLAEEREIRRGLERDEFEPHYQPTVDLVDGRITGVEALVRWRHPTKGLLSPAHFLDRVTEAGLLPALGGSVLRRALRDAARWQMPGDFHVAVNIAGQQLDDDGLVSQLECELATSGLDPRRLRLEVVEDHLSDIGTVAKVLTSVKAVAPVEVYIDDFGTGHSSLSRLHALPVDGLKIDRSFIANMQRTRDDLTIVSTIIALGRELDLAVVAEGVESDDQRAALLRLGCRAAQGWHFSPAVPPEDVPRLLVLGRLGGGVSVVPRRRR